MSTITQLEGGADLSAWTAMHGRLNNRTILSVPHRDSVNLPPAAMSISRMRTELVEPSMALATA